MKNLVGISLTLALLGACTQAETRQDVSQVKVQQVKDNGKAIGREYGGKGTGYGQVKKIPSGQAVPPSLSEQFTQVLYDGLIEFVPIDSVAQVGHYDFDVKGFSQQEFQQASHGLENRVIVWLNEVSGTGVEITFPNERQDMHIRFWSKEEGDKYGFTYILDK